MAQTIVHLQDYSFVLSLFSVFSPLKLYPQVQNYDHLFKNISTGPLVSTGVPLTEGGGLEIVNRVCPNEKLKA